MKLFSKSIIAAMALLVGIGLATSCDDANEYEDVNTDNPTFGNADGTATHPESLGGTKYVRAQGYKYNAFGEEIQGFVESVEFVTEDSVIVTMSQGVTEGTWIDESNDQFQPHYYYTYSKITGKIEIKKQLIDDKGAVSLPTIFMGTAISGAQDMITIVHFGDTPAQTYLVKQ